MRVTTIIRLLRSIESFADFQPVDVLRPARCPHCKQPSKLPGLPLGLHGHGSVDRTVEHVDSSGRRRRLVLWLRRYRCTTCRRTCRVEPVGLVRGYRYSLVRIVLILLMWAVQGHSAGAARMALGYRSYSDVCDANRWRSPRRWARSGPLLFGDIADGLLGRPKAVAAALMGRLLGAHLLDVQHPTPPLIETALLRRHLDGGAVM